MIENTGRKIGGGGITGRHNLGAYIYTVWESARFAIWRSGVRSPLGPPNGKIYRYVGFPVFILRHIKGKQHAIVLLFRDIPKYENHRRIY